LQHRTPLHADAAEELTVVCLCAAWCRTCESFRPDFDALGQDADLHAVLRWVDIEDEAHLLADLDIQDFPTLLIARGRMLLFFGTVLPRIGLVRSLIRRTLEGPSEPLHHPQCDTLLAAFDADRSAVAEFRPPDQP